MHKCKALWTVLVVVWLAASPALGQMCGDANADDRVTIGDIVVLINHMALFADPIPNPYGADCDQRTGITFGDVMAITEYLYYTGTPLECPPTMEYGFAPSEADTVFLPTMANIPEAFNEVSLPVLTSFAPNTNGFYFPIAFGETMGPGRFSPYDVAFSTGGLLNAAIQPPDSVVYFGLALIPGDFTGRNEFLNVTCKRNSAGPASITSAPYERSDLWKIAVCRDGDLYTPVIVYREIAAPVPQVTVDPTSISFTAMAGSWALDSYDITFTSDIAGVSFELVPSDGWIVIQDFQPGGYTTPVTITVQGDGTYLGIGDHTGAISIVNPDPADVEFNTTTIDVSFHATDPLALPVGDFNCDGVLSISDVAIMIDHLFIHPGPIPPCE